jgi:DNA-binding response OmpR family regulator
MIAENQKAFPGKRIMLVEDEETMAVGLQYNLTEEGYEVTWAKDGRQAMELFDNQEFDMIILDIMLPFHDGFEITQKIRVQSPQIPILILTARSGVEDRVKGLELGSDDYMTKPFHLPELLLRIRGMLKRKMWYQSYKATPAIYRFGENEINFENLVCRREKKNFRLTPREAMVIKYLIDHKGKIVSREDLLEHVWQMAPDVETRTVDNFISRLRKYFEPDPAHPTYIKAVRSAGYLFSDQD